MKIIEASENKEHAQKSVWKRELWSWVTTIAVVVLIVLFVRSYLFTNYIVYGQSMMPTIQDGERIIVNKIGYDINGGPERFDLVIFHADEETDYIKRIIGLPGDHIAYEDDVLYVNGEPYEEPFLDGYKEEYGKVPFTEDFTLEELTKEEVVPEGQVFVLGDNRRNSLDSRQIGFIDKETLVGKANLSYWPPDNFRVFQ